MRRCLLDTGIAGDYIYRRAGVFARAAQRKAAGDQIGISVPVLGELWYGVEFSSSRTKNRHRLLAALSSLKVWPFTNVAANEYGRLFALLRRRGRMMPQVDVQTAAIALTLGNCVVITKDSDFA